MWGRAPPIRVFSSLWWFVAVFLKGDSGDLQVGPRGWLGGGPGLAGAAFLASFHICVLHAFHFHLFSPSFIWIACLQGLTEVVRNHGFLDTAIRKEKFSSNHLCLVWWVAQSVKNLPAVQETQV